MRFRAEILAAFLLGASVSAHAQLSQDSRYTILGSMIAMEGAARIPMPLGKNGVEVSDSGLIDRSKLQKEISNNGNAITPGKVVSITSIDFGEKEIEFELNNGGTKKKGILSHISINAGAGVSSSNPNQQPEPDAIGSKITLKFARKIPSNLSVEQLKDLLNPVLDFTKQTVARAGVESLPPAFQDAVAAKEAIVGMDSNTVMLALGRPDHRGTQKTDKGVMQEEWRYEGKGRRNTFVTFENDIVVEVRQY